MHCLPLLQCAQLHSSPFNAALCDLYTAMRLISTYCDVYSMLFPSLILAALLLLLLRA